MTMRIFIGNKNYMLHISRYLFYTFNCKPNNAYKSNLSCEHTKSSEPNPAQYQDNCEHNNIYKLSDSCEANHTSEPKPCKYPQNCQPNHTWNTEPEDITKPENPTILENPTELEPKPEKRLNISTLVAKFFEPAAEIVPRKFKENNVT